MAQRALRGTEPLTPDLTAELQGVADRYSDYGVLRNRVDVGSAIEDLGAPAGS
ncbi:ABC-type nitrate/sulfonate/bicarbonate transport system, periplasmic component [Pseudonocardia sp. Ae168_Ps1]|uniref:hypothetical protein n=1 Tax=unclassified Pseudonocardia TaxID=2619320 RepID=UPI00095DB63C|nr:MULTISPECIES: hypothetical protein [unclassified Pseudonocardia]OLL73058.1 ABC-type nitrate/sulfonate/bicarbonate transport system, periplasmic component [Pseudonocardia sp. Ae150A_Ps1]OLL79033.1 ABC-type nitrate/sulfonate/bicarbonate transport system, periplasmic component [Pseudonocardia sp. Ae168_Ps1]OLL86829.1 ABC-type nitrate/sulfonate/bicarbonate transport system, periplasmic component [Pseudonocardia sp. Ae263_Ps1]OLL93127.1 ABC-type nitrate/sulfonate/bicarbonate transport system, per